MYTDTVRGRPCGRDLYVDFLARPRAQRDLSCVDETLPPDFDGAEFGPWIFGTGDVWGD